MNVRCHDERVRANVLCSIAGLQMRLSDMVVIFLNRRFILIFLFLPLHLCSCDMADAWMLYALYMAVIWMWYAGTLPEPWV